MNTNRYYFTSFIEDDSLSILAVEAKELLQQNDNIVKIFQVNDELLYGHSPRQVLFLMKQNNNSIFSSSSANENISVYAESNQGLSTPVTRNLDISNVPRRNLLLDDAEKKVYHSIKFEPNTPVGQKTGIFRSEDKAIWIPPIDETVISDEKFVSSVGSTGSPKADNEESPRSAAIAKMTANLTMTEKVFSELKEVVDSSDSSSQDSLSNDVSILTANLTTSKSESENPSMGDGEMNVRKQESPRSAEISSMTFNLTKDDECRSLNQDDQMAGNDATNTDNPDNPGKCDNPNLASKDFSYFEGNMNVLEPTVLISETPSPVKRSKMISISFGTQEFANPEKVTMADISPEYTKAIVDPTQGDETSSPNEASEGFTRGERKRKSLSPRKRNTAPFRSMPRVIKLAGETEIDIEVCCDLEDNSALTTSRSLSADSRNDSIKERSKNPSMGESKIKTSPLTLERYSSPSERPISIGSPRNVSGRNSPSTPPTLERYSSPSERPIFIGSPCNISGRSSPNRDKDDFAEGSPSYIPSIVATATRDRPCESEPSPLDNEADSALLKHKILKFNMLLDLRGKFLDKTFCSFLSFQNSLEFLSSHVLSVSQALLKIDTSDADYSTMELKEAVDDACAVALKITDKFKLWETNVDLDVKAWHELSHQIQQLKSQFEPLLNNEGKPAVDYEVLQVYEYEVKAIWKKMDEMLITEGSMRALFSNTAHDFEMLMKMFVKCLIFIGILLPR